MAGAGDLDDPACHLAEAAEQHGFSTFVAEVLPHNHPMIDVFRGSGFPVELRSVPGALEIELPTSLSAEAVAQFEERERIGAVAAVRSFLEPRSVAVIGASRRRGTIGGEILHNLLAGGFGGAVCAVNVKADVVQSLPAYRSVANIPGGVELAVVAVPAEGVVSVARECAAAGALCSSSHPDLRRPGGRAPLASASCSRCAATPGSGSSARTVWAYSTHLRACG